MPYDLSRLKPEQREQGEKGSGYEENGPYHCKDCIHKVHPNVPICIHPIVIEFASMLTLCFTDNPPSNKGRIVDLEKGCCKYVNQHNHNHAVETK